MLDKNSVEHLKDFITIREAALRLGISKQAVHNKIFDQELLDLGDILRIGGDNPIYLLKESAVSSKLLGRRQNVATP